MRTEIKELHERLKTTTVYVTHDQIEAMTMANRIIILRDGRIEQAGSPLTVYDRPANLFVAGFIGSPAMNLLPGTIEGGLFRTEKGVELPLPAEHRGTVGQKAVYGIRPEHLAPGIGTRATVNVTEPTGPELHIYANWAGKEVCVVTSERMALKRGDDLLLTPRPERAHLFDADSGASLT
jgi:multiple sugar transport system ATP-binding protein